MSWTHSAKRRGPKPTIAAARARAVVRGRQLIRCRIPEGHQQGLEVRGGDPGRRAPGFRARPHVPLATLLGDPPLHRGRPEVPLCRDGRTAAFTHLVRLDNP